MNTVIKRDGTKEPFDPDRIIEAVSKAMRATGKEVDLEFCKRIANKVKKAKKKEMSVSEIQDIVEEALMASSHKDVAKRYIIYRQQRDVARYRESKMVKTFNEIIEVVDNDVKNENANINGNIPAGQMMKFASESTKDYALNYLLSPEQAEAHRDGVIHIHDLDYYPTRTTTCVQIDLDKIFKNGFSTNDGSVREPQSIRSYAALAAIVLQSNQNEQHGGQAIPAFDFFMAEGVRKSFKKIFMKYHKLLTKAFDGDIDTLEKLIGKIEMGNKRLKEVYPDIYTLAHNETREETAQAMEAFIHNMCTMHQQVA